jgi:hypothetical protein
MSLGRIFLVIKNKCLTPVIIMLFTYFIVADKDNNGAMHNITPVDSEPQNN